MFKQGFTCPALLKFFIFATHTGLSPTLVDLSRIVLVPHMKTLA